MGRPRWPDQVTGVIFGETFPRFVWRFFHLRSSIFGVTKKLHLQLVVGPMTVTKRHQKFHDWQRRIFGIYGSQEIFLDFRSTIASTSSVRQCGTEMKQLCDVSKVLPECYVEVMFLFGGIVKYGLFTYSVPERAYYCFMLNGSRQDLHHVETVTSRPHLGPQKVAFWFREMGLRLISGKSFGWWNILARNIQNPSVKEHSKGNWHSLIFL